MVSGIEAYGCRQRVKGEGATGSGIQDEWSRSRQAGNGFFCNRRPSMQLPAMFVSSLPEIR